MKTRGSDLKEVTHLLEKFADLTDAESRDHLATDELNHVTDELVMEVLLQDDLWMLMLRLSF